MHRYPLVGRDTELATLRAVLGDGPGVGALVVGAAGLGKTRLVSELVSQVTPDSLLVGHCLQVGSEPIPLASVDQILRQAVGSVDSPDALPSTYASELARFNSWLDLIEGGPDSGPGAQPARTIVFEDLHWADATTARFVAYLASCLPWRRVRLVVTVRPEPSTAALWTDLSRRPGVECVILSALPAQDAARLIRGIDAGLGDEKVTDLIALAEGNPYFLEELATHGGAVPARLTEWLYARVEELSYPARGVVHCLAIAGGDIEDYALAAVCELPSDALAAATQESMDAGCVDAVGDGYVLRHALLRESVLAHLSPSSRRLLHRRVGDALSADAERGFVLASRCAAHYDAAHARDDGARMHRLAAELARVAADFPEAWTHYRHVLVHEAVRDTDLVLHAAEAAHWADDMSSGVQLLEEARAGAVTLRDEVAILERLGRYRWDLGQSASSRIAYGEADQLAARLAADDTVRARVDAGVARAALIAADYARATRRAELALTRLDRVGMPALTADALDTLGVARCMSGQEAGIDDLREALRIASEVDDAEETCRAYANLIYVLSARGRHDEAADVASAALAATTRYGLGRGGGAALALNASTVLVNAGRLTAAESLIERLLATQRLHGRASRVHIVFAELLLLTDRSTEAARHLALAEGGRDIDDPWAVTDRTAVTAEVHLATGEGEAARQAVSAAFDLLGDVGEPALTAHLCWLGARVEAETARWQPVRDQHARLDQARRYVSSLPAPASGATAAELAASSASARLELARLEGRATPHDFAEVAALWQCTGRRKYVCVYTTLEAEAWLLAKDRTRARRAAVKALNMAREMGAAGLTRTLLDLARQGRLQLAGEAPQRPPRFPGLELTAREEDVLERLADGLTNRQIGRALAISERTASVHVSNVLRKLQVDNRVQAATIARLRPGAPGGDTAVFAAGRSANQEIRS